MAYPPSIDRFHDLDHTVRLAISDLITIALVKPESVSDLWRAFLTHHGVDALGGAYVNVNKRLDLISDLRKGNRQTAYIRKNLEQDAAKIQTYEYQLRGLTDASLDERLLALKTVVDLTIFTPEKVRLETLEFLAENFDLIKKVKPEYSQEDEILYRLMLEGFVQHE